MTNDFLFELGCEELPSGSVQSLSQALTQEIRVSLEKAQINFQAIKPFATPRRIAFLVTGMADEQKEQRSIRRGPAYHMAYNAEGEPMPALLGFAKSCGVAVDCLVVDETDKGTWLVYEAISAGKKTRELLPQIVQQALKNLPITKPMRWGDGAFEFVRPVHWVVMLLGKEVIAAEFFGLSTGRKSYGHRFHHPQCVEIDEPNHYEACLKEAHVLVDFNLRRQLICEEVKDLALQYAAEPIMPEALLDEITSIVEWPQALLAQFESHLLEVPPEALIASLQNHQKCFALRKEKDQLLPYFITVSNIVSKNPQRVILGNEKVVHARLNDAAFFFHQDKKHRLFDYLSETKRVVFQEKLGTLYDKVQRLEGFIIELVSPLGLDAHEARRAAQLSKCDLMTNMVGEFPELQGIMGYYYARHDAEPLRVACAIKEHYLPRAAGDILPQSSLGIALSLADRFDTLVGIFAIGAKPSGVKDPFKLRRHALAIVRMLIAIPTPMRLSELIQFAIAGYQNALPQVQDTLFELKEFIFERLNFFYQGKGYSSDSIQAIRARQDEWFFDFDKRLHALKTFITLPEAKALSSACKRVNNLLQQGDAAFSELQDSLLEEGAEKSLYFHLREAEKLLEPLYALGDYTAILTQLSALKEPIDAFFDQVMVMVEEESVRKNRLALVRRMQSVLQGVADISLLQFHA